MMHRALSIVALRNALWDNKILQPAGPWEPAFDCGQSRSQPMSYAYDVRIAAHAPALERAAFIRRTYGHLAAAILAFIGIEFALLRLTPGIGEVVVGMMSVSWLFILGGFMVVSFIANYWAR